MPDGRFLSKSIAYSAQVGSVSLEADYLFMRMIPHLDSAGRMTGEPTSIRALCCPLRKEITDETVEECLVELAAEGLVQWYAGPDGAKHLALPGFTAHQRGARLDREAQSSRPAPTPENAVVLRRTPDNSGQLRSSKVKLSEVKESNAGAGAARVRKDGRARPSWLVPSSVVWEKHKGAGTFPWGKAGKQLKPLNDAGHSGERIASNLDRYIPKAGKFVSLARFAETFSDHDALVLSGPVVVDSWLSPEVDRLTAPPGGMVA